jgi:hypothetical protein
VAATNRLASERKETGCAGTGAETVNMRAQVDKPSINRRITLGCDETDEDGR